MNVTYEHRPAMTFIGFSTSIRPEEGYQKCPEFWDREYARKYARLWQTMQPETPVEKAILENGIPFSMKLRPAAPTDVLDAMKQASQSAADAGVADMSLDEINDEIAQVRAGK